ncbi:MAG: hypothetical protein ACE3JP_11810 [Ectobacillus sp.]
MEANKAVERIHLLLEELIVSTSRKETQVSTEELLFSLNCLLRSFQALLDNEEKNWDYIETKFNAAFNLLTGRTVYPF